MVTKKSRIDRRPRVDRLAERIRGAIERCGAYTDLIRTKDALYIVPTDEGIKLASDMVRTNRGNAHYEGLIEMIEDHLANGWEQVNPEDVGAMTEGFMMSDEILRNSNGKVVLVGRVYWFEDYAVLNEVDHFAKGMELCLRREGKPLSTKTLREYQDLLAEEEAGNKVDWQEFARRHQ